MDSIKRMNQAITYIENHLKVGIDYAEIERMTLCPSGLFQRMFSVLAGIPLSEYIRSRKLSQAATDLATGNYTVTEVAFDYGYDSSDAFSSAFKKMHGVTPSQVIKGNLALVHVPKVTFSMTLKGSVAMKYRIVTREAFKVLGKSIVTSGEDNMKNHTISKFWMKAPKEGLEEQLCKLSKNQPFLGMCYNMNNDGSFRYMIGVETTKSDDSLEVLDVPASTWAVFESVGPMPDAIMQVWKSIYEDFFPSSGYKHAGTPDFEAYPESGSQRKDYRAQVWIPVVKVES